MFEDRPSPADCIVYLIS